MTAIDADTRAVPPARREWSWAAWLFALACFFPARRAAAPLPQSVYKKSGMAQFYCLNMPQLLTGPIGPWQTTHYGRTSEAEHQVLEKFPPETSGPWPGLSSKPSTRGVMRRLPNPSHASGANCLGRGRRRPRSRFIGPSSVDRTIPQEASMAYKPALRAKLALRALNCTKRALREFLPPHYGSRARGATSTPAAV